MIFSWYAGEAKTAETYSGRISLVNNQVGLGKGSINLTSVRETDTGWYECKLTFPNRSPSSRRNGTWFHMAVDGGTLMKIPPVNQTVMEYEPAFFHCTVKNPESMFVTWFKDSKPLIEFHDLASRSVMGADGSLLISPALMGDLGVYECRVKNILEEEENAHAYLNVQCKFFIQNFLQYIWKLSLNVSFF